MRIGPCDPEDEVRRESVHGGGQAAFQRFEIGVSGDVPGEVILGLGRYSLEADTILMLLRQI